MALFSLRKMLVQLSAFLSFFNKISAAPTGNLSVTHTGFRSIAYFPNWVMYARHYSPLDLTPKDLTHVMYCFADVRDTGEVFLTDTWSDTDKHWENDPWDDSGSNVHGNVKQMYLLKKANRNLKTLLSIGGWTYSPHFAAPMATAIGRSLFAKSAVQYVKDLGFDGLDIDWEYPQNDAQALNYVQLLQAIRSELTAYSNSLPNKPHFLLSVASPAGPEKYERLHMKDMDAQLDFWNLMAYDYSGAWDTITGHQANVYPSKKNPASTPFSTDAAIQYYKSQGISPDRITLGMPLYGRSFLETKGPGTAYAGIGKGTWEIGVWDYKALPRQGEIEYYDAEIIAAWSYNASGNTMISYDNPISVKAKVNYIQTQHLGGAMWWEVNGDSKYESGRSLMKLAADTMAPLERSKNILNYPQSKYDNIKKGM